MPGDILWILALIPVLLLALFFYLVVRIIWAVARSVGGLLSSVGRPAEHGRWWRRRSSVGRTPVGFRTGMRICPNPHCRRANVTVARYCAVCGEHL